MEVSPYQDLFGRLLDVNPRLLIKLGNLETRLDKPRILNIPIDRPIYVTGLARAGSTILLEMLGSHPAAATHKYRDFPLVPIPLWWHWFIEHAGKGTSETVERAHRDGILVTPDSPEAMEEILWMLFFRDCHNPSVNNIATGRHPEFEAFYRAHVRKILLLRKGRRYIAKGNYNVARLEYLHTLFPDARFVIPVRDPVAHVASLLKQHRLFCAAETADPKVLNYMRRSGHFEFGLDRRPLNLGDDAVVREIRALWDKGDDIRGFAKYWASVYGHVADLLERNETLARQALLVRYEDLCDAPEAWLDTVHAHCELDTDRRTLEGMAARIAAPAYYRHGFSDAERAVIDGETRVVKARIDRLCRERSAPTGERPHCRSGLQTAGSGG